MSKKKLIIIGGGFGGLNAALALKKTNYEILLIDKANHHLFQPLLYQVASAALSPANIASPIRQILSRQDNVDVIMGEVTKLDKVKHMVHLSTGESYYFDYLIVATGAKHSYFGHDEWEKYAPGLKTIDDALLIKQKIFVAFEEAEKIEETYKLNDPSMVASYMRFVIVGGGPTGVEMAGSIAEITRKTLKNNYRNIDPENSEIYLMEGEECILPTYPKSLSETSRKYLENLGVKVLTNTRVTNVTEKGVEVGDELIESKNVIWAAGNQASPLLEQLGVHLDRSGRVFVNKDMTIPGSTNIFVIGDAANWPLEGGGALPGIAPVALQEGRYVAKLLKKNYPVDKRPPFSYFDKGALATIGKGKAVGVYKNVKFKGLFAWLIWSFVHVFYLISFSNRAVVMIQWVFWYITNKRQARIITKRMQ